MVPGKSVDSSYMEQKQIQRPELGPIELKDSRLSRDNSAGKAAVSLAQYITSGEGTLNDAATALHHTEVKQKRSVLEESFLLTLNNLAAYRESWIAFEEQPAVREARGTVFDGVVVPGKTEIIDQLAKETASIKERMEQLLNNSARDELFPGAKEAFIKSLGQFINERPANYSASGFMGEMLTVLDTLTEQFNTGVVNSKSAGFPLYHAPGQAELYQETIKRALKLSFAGPNGAELKNRLQQHLNEKSCLSQIAAGAYSS